MTEKKINIDKIKEIFEEREIFEDKEKKKLKAKKIKSITDSVLFSELFQLAYNTFNDNLHLNKGKAFSEFFKKFKNIPESLRVLIEEYGGGKEIGDYHVFQRINKQGRLHRKIMNEMIVLFERVFLEE